MTRPEPPDWTTDPVERARFLDGELTREERAARESRLASDAAARARVERQGELLAVLRRAREALPAPPPDLADRVRAALAADREAGVGEPTDFAAMRRGRVRTLAFAAAAAAALAAIWIGIAPAPTTHAYEEAVVAADAARRAREGTLPGRPGASCEQGVASPYRFPFVQGGEWQIAGCAPTKGGVVSVLRNDEGSGLSPGLVSVPAPRPAPTTGRAPDIGELRLEDMVVFDVSIGGARYYLAAPRESVDRLGSCAACHGRSRVGQENPHRFRLRSTD